MAVLAPTKFERRSKHVCCSKIENFLTRAHDYGIEPVQNQAPWAVPALMLLLVSMPFIWTVVWLLAQILIHADYPRFFLPLVLPLALIVPIVAIVHSLGLYFIVRVFVHVYRHTSKARQARFVIPVHIRAKRLWAVLATAVRLNAARVQAPENSPWAKRRIEEGLVPYDRSKRWKANWEEVAHLRSSRQQNAWNHEVSLPSASGHIFGPLIATAMISLIIFAVHAFFSLALPWFQLDKHLRLIVVVPAAAFSMRIFFDFFRASIMDPGHPETGGALTAPAKALTAMYDKACELPMQTQWCTKCNAPKPARCHHCRICRRCVLKMDHHCIFVNNCIGLRNYRNFCLLLMDLVAGLIVLMVSLLPQLPSAVFTGQKSWDQRLHIIAAFLLGVVAIGFLAPLLRFHLQLVLRDETTLENMRQSSAIHPVSKRGNKAQCDDVGQKYKRSALENFSDIFWTPPIRYRRHFETVLALIAPDVHIHSDPDCNADFGVPNKCV